MKNIPLIGELPHPPQDRCSGALRTSRGFFPMRALSVKTKVTGLVFDSTLCQTFKNTLDVPLEATYVFPLPARAAVRQCHFEVGGRLIEAKLEERGAARQRYDDAIAAGKQAAIAEQERSDVFSMRVGNILPGEEVKVHLVLCGPLALNGCEATFRFPLVTSPRYSPGTPLDGESVGKGSALDTDRVPDASRISPPVLLEGLRSPVALEFSLEVDKSGLPITSMRSSLHTTIVDEDEHSYTLQLQPGERLNRDFILRFFVADESLNDALKFSSDGNNGEEDEGTFELTLVPPNSKVTTAKDVVFVLDTSGSMNGWKMVAARRAISRMVDTLCDRDRFSVMPFASRHQEFRSGLTKATDGNRFAAIEYISKQSAGGGTEMLSPLLAASALLNDSDEQRLAMIVLVTDGQVGNEADILQSLAKAPGDFRISTIGIDRAVNEGFLRRLSDSSGGQCQLVESEEVLDKAMRHLGRSLSAPVVTDLKFSVEEGAIHSVAPQKILDLLAGVPVRVLGRYHGSPRSIVISGLDAQGQAFRRVCKATPSEHPGLGAIWAKQHLQDLEDQYDKGDRGLRDVIIETSLRFSTLCRFTAFVAVGDEVVNEAQAMHEIIQPVEAVMGSRAPMSAPMPRRRGIGNRSPKPAMAQKSASMKARPKKPATAPIRLDEGASSSSRGSASKGFFDRVLDAVGGRKQETPLDIGALLVSMKSARSLKEKSSVLQQILDSLKSVQPKNAALNGLMSTLEKEVPDFLLHPQREQEELWKTTERTLESLMQSSPKARKAFWS